MAAIRRSPPSFYTIACVSAIRRLGFGDVPKDEPLSGVSEAVGGQLTRIRKELGWSVERLAQRCKEVGAPQLTVNALYVIESGRKEKGTGRRRRHVTVDEWLAIAGALRVHPVDLLIPVDPADDEPYGIPRADDEPYGIPPAASMTVADARKWMTGRGYLDQPQTVEELLEVIREMPKDRARAMSNAWFTRERQVQLHRQTNKAAEQEGDEDGPDQED